jgi:basic membrane protein A
MEKKRPSGRLWIAAVLVAIVVVGAAAAAYYYTAARAPPTPVMTTTAPATTLPTTAVTTVPAATTGVTTTTTAPATTLPTTAVTTVPAATTGVTTTTTAPATTPAGRTYKMAVMLGGDETDAGFSYMAIQGAYAIRDKYGWQVDISRTIQYVDGPRVATDYAHRGYDLVWAQGGQFQDQIYGVAPNFPNTYFVQVPGWESPPANTAALGPAFQVNGFYLAGVLAGKMTKTNAVACIYGDWLPYLSMEFWAFKAGVESANPSAKVYARVTGAWGDASLGYQVAKSLIQTKDVDIIVQIADLTGRGIIRAAQQFGVMVIGTVADQSVLAPEATLTSVMMDTAGFMEMIVQSVMDGTFKDKYGGKLVDVDLSSLAPFHNFDQAVPQEVKDLLKQTDENIKNGTIVVPRTVTEAAPKDPT